MVVGLYASAAIAQTSSSYEKQLWAMGFFNFRLNDQWVYSQDVAYQHSMESPSFTRLLTRSYFSRQLTGVFSVHAGLNFLYKIIEEDNNAIEIRPWLGAKVRWPYFWRFHFIQYFRLEQRFEHTLQVHEWDNNFRARYKIITNVPLNHHSLSDHTMYWALAYEYYTNSFKDELSLTKAAHHRFECGLGYKPNVKSRAELIVDLFRSRDEVTDIYYLSSVVLFLKYKRYIHWE